MTPERFVEALQARGVTLSVVNNRLKLDPGVTWRTLTPDEAQCVADHRAAIKRLADGSEPTPTKRRTSEPEPEAAPTEPTPEPVVWTVDYSRRITTQDLHNAGVTGSSRATYERAREWLADQDRERRTDYVTGVMFESLRRHQRGTHGGFRG